MKRFKFFHFQIKKYFQINQFILSTPFFDSLPPISSSPIEFTRRIRARMKDGTLKANELRIFAIYLAIALLPAAADIIQKRNPNKIAEIFVKVSNLILLCAAFNLLAQRVSNTINTILKKCNGISEQINKLLSLTHF